MNGTCTGGSTSGQGGVACGGMTCAAGQSCCVDFASAPFCTANVDACDGVTATCDGVEDCGGNACCEPVIGLPVSCSSNPTCTGPGGGDQICRDPADCTDPMARTCCLGLGLPGEPWGRCRPSCPPA